MGIRTISQVVITCDICESECGEKDGQINIQVNGGDGRDVGPATVEGNISFFQPYGVSDGIICVACKKKWLTKYVESL